jgi:hypothetical protein
VSFEQTQQRRNNAAEAPMPTNFVCFGSENSSAAHPVKIASHRTIGMIEVFAGSIGVQPEGENGQQL